MATTEGWLPLPRESSLHTGWFSPLLVLFCARVYLPAARAAPGYKCIRFSTLTHGNESFEAAEALVLLNTNPPAAPTAPTLVWKGANRSLNARVAKNNLQTALSVTSPASFAVTLKECCRITCRRTQINQAALVGWRPRDRAVLMWLASEGERGTRHLWFHVVLAQAALPACSWGSRGRIKGRSCAAEEKLHTGKSSG